MPEWQGPGGQNACARPRPPSPAPRGRGWAPFSGAFRDVGIQRSKKVKRGLLEWEMFIVFNINTNVSEKRN